MNPAAIDFPAAFRTLTGNLPFPWQEALFAEFVAGRFPEACDLPTGLGKTSVIAVWLLALAATPPGKVPRRLVYVVNRRTVVDQSTRAAEELRANLHRLPDVFTALADRCALRPEFKGAPGPDTPPPLAISTLRGQFADNREWSADPARPAVVVGTVDMVGSRLLFEGYGCGFKTRPLHAGFLCQDALLVHDEAHLEPAFQTLIESIRDEHHREPAVSWTKLRVMALTATLRRAGGTFRLTGAELDSPVDPPDPPAEPLHHVWRRLRAKKGVRLTTATQGKVADAVAGAALRHKESSKAVLVFARTINDVITIRAVLTEKASGVPTEQVQILTGTMRGREREELVTRNEVFARFLPESRAEPQPGTVYLVCTSAGEVGIDISADHMASDLTTLDGMAQRLGRVNRRGGGRAEVDVVYESDPKKPDEAPEKARRATRAVLEHLPPCDWAEDRCEASPHEIGRLIRGLTREERDAAFAPPPEIVPATDILFDTWAMTTARGKLPGRPPVEDWLHGLSEWEPPQTRVAWRAEVDQVREDADAGRDRDWLRNFAGELLDDYPLKPHESLNDRSDRVFDALSKRLKAAGDSPVWVVTDDGDVTPMTLADVVKAGKERIERQTVLLPPSAGGLTRDGLLDGTSSADAEGVTHDVADIPSRRVRVWDTDPAADTPPRGMRLVRTVDTRPEADDPDDDEAPSGRRYWFWYEAIQSGDGDGSTGATGAVLWQTHTDDVVHNAESIVAKLDLSADLRNAVILAARWHDLGKRRRRFQQTLGNYANDPLLAKSDPRTGRRGLRDDYRHEFGSLADVLDGRGAAEFAALSDDMKDVVLHLIAAHHGRGRPHFPAGEAFDPDAPAAWAAEIAAEVPRRFARLQRQYGRWGLAYLESILRAADYAASANPSKYVRVTA